MELRGQASEAFQQVSTQIKDFRSGTFFREHEHLIYLSEAAEAMVNFLLERPAMLVCDAQNKEGILDFLNKEWFEAETADPEEKLHDDPEVSHLFTEIGDVGFFALLSGVLHWDELDSSQRDFVERALFAAGEMAEEHDISLPEAIIYAASVKDPRNYRTEFYQIKEGEETEGLIERAIKTGKLHRKIRSQLNGEWREGGDIRETLAQDWADPTKLDAVTRAQIETLFILAHLPIEVYAYGQATHED